MKSLHLIWMLLCSNIIIAQTFDSLSIGNINARINSDGSLFWDKISLPKFEFPKGSNKHTSFAAGTWMGGFDSGGLLRVAAQTYRHFTCLEEVAGPIRNVPIPVYDSLYNQKYNKVWKITKNQIDFHKNKIGTFGYVPSPSILNWPGNGEVSQAENAQLAPYFDANNDQMYNPLFGDYPLIKGDEAIFIMFRDEKSDSSLNVEAKAMFYAYNCDSILQNTIFAEFKLTNTNAFAINNFKFASWNDFDLGLYSDDYVGCDSLNNFFYVYNGDDFDDGISGYGFNLPAYGVVFLNNPMTNFMVYENDFSNDGHPENNFQFYKYMDSKWKDGNNLTYGGQGNDTLGISTTHMFTGIPEDNLGWSEVSLGNQPFDRRGLGSTTIQVFQPGETIQIDLAYVVSRGSSHLNSLRKLRTDVQYVKDSYQNQGCTNVSIQKQTETFPFSIYPNPNNSKQLTFKGLNPDQYECFINNQVGQNVWKTKILANQFDIDLPDLENGLYIILLKDSKGNLAQSKLLIIK